MKIARLFFLALLALFLQQKAPARADTVELSATVDARIGYGTNPFLQTGQGAGSVLVGGTIAPLLTLRGPVAVTELSGSYNRDQYLRRYGDADDFNVELRRTQQLSAKLSVNARIGYFSSISGLLSPYYNSVVVDPGAVDQLAVGQRQRRAYAGAGLNWQPTARDSYYLTGNVEHDSYSGFGSSYDYYAMAGGYSRQVDARTKVGVQLGVGKYDSSGSSSGQTGASSSESASPSVTLERILSARWTFKGSVGAIVERERERLTHRSRVTVSPGFSASFCATYPRLSLCLTGDRETASSGLGGLRRQTQFGVSGTYTLTARSRILFAGSYGISKTSNDLAINNVGSVGSLRYATARLAYQRDLTRRVSAGVSGSYQSRSGARFPEAHALAISFNLTARLGHLT